MNPSSLYPALRIMNLTLLPRLLALLVFTTPLLAKDIAKEMAVPNITLLPPEPTPMALKVTPDRPDWTYPLGATASFRVSFDLQPYPAVGVPIKYKLGPEMIEGAEKTATVPADGLVLPVSAVNAPGFVRCIVTGTLEGKELRQLATIGFAPEKIAITQTEPADFDAFWNEQKAALAKVPIEPQLTPAPELSNDKVETFYLSLQNVGGWAGPSRFYGVLCVPRGEGPFPALLNVPGAGVRPYKGNMALAEKGIITLQVGVHGIPVNQSQEIYDQLGRGALANYNRYQLDSRFDYYYRRIYLGCLRGNDYLTGHPKWDKKNLFVAGSSQGGQLSIVTAGLDPRVTGLSATYPAYCDVTGYLHGRAGGWPGLFRKNKDGTVSDQPIEEKRVTTTYYDAVNFARRLKVPGFYTWGYNDETCPATSTFAAYNIITAPRELVILPASGHKATPLQGERINAWILARLGLSPK